MDLDTGVGIAGALISLKVVAERVLGPSADYLGEELRQYTQKRVENVHRIFRKAEERLGDRIDEGGRVPPKVIKEILDDGSFAEDELAVEYFGGVLASSRSGVNRDDRGAAFAKLVSQLTVYQLRSHYAMYLLFKDLYDGEALEPGNHDDRRAMTTFMPYNSFAVALDLGSEEDFWALLTHSMFGLSRLDLIGEHWQLGSASQLQKIWSQVPDEGIVVQPSALGVELFLWAQGLGHIQNHHFLD